MRHSSVLAIALAALLPRAAPAAIPVEERAALIDFYLSTDGPHWRTQTSWKNADGTDFNDPGTECSWFGVTCDFEGHYVQELALRANDLAGTVPESIATLPHLRLINVGDNRLQGPLSFIASLPALELFFARGNRFSGAVPELSALPLANFDIRGNQLAGRLPSPPPSLAATAGGASVCPNAFDPVDDPGWDAATGQSPWWLACDRIFANGF